jgi:murein DD-endopeptidase MepM/ murein hydrolase activator NlpD
MRGLVILSVFCVAACGGREEGLDLPSTSVPAIGTDIHLAPDTTLVQGLVPRNATLSAMLHAEGLAADVVEGVVQAARTVFDPRRLRSLQPFSLERTVDGALRYFEYEIDGESLLRVIPVNPLAREELHAEVLPIPKTLEHAAAAGRIDRQTPSLFQAMTAAGERGELAVAVAQVFAGDIDFNSDLQPGDQFAVVFERFARDDRPEDTSYGVITAAEFQNKGRLLRAIRFTPPGGTPGYYDEEGRSLQRFFLRSPLRFEPRVTSRFSLRRRHPVLHTTRAHTGVDYAAPHGADVVAVAAGTVISATFDNTNGRMVRLRHASGYHSYYLHLSAFGSGIRAGARVRQGQVIGKVGATGLATGPHLHYGLRKDGAWVDPLREHSRLPPGEPIPAVAMAEFAIVREEALDRLGAAVQERIMPFGAPDQTVELASLDAPR